MQLAPVRSNLIRIDQRVGLPSSAVQALPAAAPFQTDSFEQSAQPISQAPVQPSEETSALLARALQLLVAIFAALAKGIPGLGGNDGAQAGADKAGKAGGKRNGNGKHKAEGKKANGKKADKVSDKELSGGKKVTGYVNGKPQKMTVFPVGNGEYLRDDAAKAFKAMQRAAKKDGIQLTPGSGFRTMEEQKKLYQAYLNGTGNLAAKPGYSNHQGGVAMDISNVGGYGTRTYQWLKENARRFGFVNDVSGEYWHWTYKR